MNNIFERIFMKTEDRHIKTCSECKFFDSRGKGSGSICRRHAPSTVRYAHSPYIEWPVVKDDDWCGEFKHKKYKSKADKNFVQNMVASGTPIGEVADMVGLTPRRIYQIQKKNRE